MQDHEAPDIKELEFSRWRAVTTSGSVGLLGGLVGQGGSFILIPLMTAYVRTLAASLTLRDARALRVPWAGADWRFRSLNANMLLYWKVLEFACREKYRAFDFGRSSPDSGTYRFKAQWGARPVPFHWHYWLREGTDLPGLSPANPKYRLAIRMWQRLPVAVAEWIGPHIVRSLP